MCSDFWHSGNISLCIPLGCPALSITLVLLRVQYTSFYKSEQSFLFYSFQLGFIITVADTCHSFFLELATRFEYKALQIFATRFNY